MSTTSLATALAKRKKLEDEEDEELDELVEDSSLSLGDLFRSARQRGYAIGRPIKQYGNAE